MVGSLSYLHCYWNKQQTKRVCASPEDLTTYLGESEKLIGKYKLNRLLQVCIILLIFAIIQLSNNVTMKSELFQPNWFEI